MFVVTGCILGLVAALLAQKPIGELVWPAKATSGLALVLLIGGSLFAFMAWAVGTPLDGAITLFLVIGFVGYLLMISAILAPRQILSEYHGTGFVVLFLVATWSWVSAIGMYSHHGTDTDTGDACILVPKPIRYDTKLNSIWEMRLPEVATSRTGPTGTVILDYHAILVAPIDGRTELYNWSKKWMRFEILDAERNPYLPTRCP